MRLATLALCMIVAGCATTVHDERDSLLAEPIDCSVAAEDIAALEAAMPTRRERALSAVQSVTPVGVVTGVLRGSYRDRAAVLTGRTEDELQARIDDIEETCGPVETPIADQE